MPGGKGGERVARSLVNLIRHLIVLFTTPVLLGALVLWPGEEIKMLNSHMSEEFNPKSKGIRSSSGPLQHCVLYLASRTSTRGSARRQEEAGGEGKRTCSPCFVLLLLSSAHSSKNLPHVLYNRSSVRTIHSTNHKTAPLVCLGRAKYQEGSPRPAPSLSPSLLPMAPSRSRASAFALDPFFNISKYLSCVSEGADPGLDCGYFCRPLL